MKNNYRKLKLSILLQTVFVTALTVLVGGVILEYVIDGVYNDSFANLFLKLMETLHVEEGTAIHLYWLLIGDNKVFFMILGFLALFSLFFYIALSKMTRYMDQIGDGIENILSDSDQPIRLITELKPLEDRLNEIKQTLKKQEKEAQEIEEKKNVPDVVYVAIPSLTVAREAAKYCNEHERCRLFIDIQDTMIMEIQLLDLTQHQSQRQIWT